MKFLQKVKLIGPEKDVKIASFILLLLLESVFSKENVACCSFPCQNGAVCMTKGFDDYVCDCYGLGFYGKNCELPTTMQRIQQWLQPGPESFHWIATQLPYIWEILNKLKFLRNIFTAFYVSYRVRPVENPPRFVYSHTYVTMQSYDNHSLYSLILPPVPKSCPTPLGVVGSKTLPDVNKVANLFKREKFKPDPMGLNLMFATFAQHFSHMFFKTNFELGPGFTWGSQTLDLSNIYGRNMHDQNLLRSFKQGKLKSQIIDGEEWPPLVKEAPVKMFWPETVPTKYRFALGHEYFSVHSGHLMWSTLWLREHNRLCDILVQEHPEWEDEQLYQTSRMALNAIMLKMVLEEYVMALCRYKLKYAHSPDNLQNKGFQYHNRIFLEYKLFYYWHGLIPDEFIINNTIYTTKQFFFNPEILLKHGMKNFIESLIKQAAGRVGHHNHGPGTIYVAMQGILQGRQLRLQSYNNYCRHFGIKPPKTFLELTGDLSVAKELEKLYVDVESVELFVGTMCGRRRRRGLFNILQLELGGTSALYALNSNPITSKNWWRPSTFGGDEVFNIIQNTTFQSFICNNIKNSCPHFSFTVPWWNWDYEEAFYIAEQAAESEGNINPLF